MVIQGSPQGVIQQAIVIGNRTVCREHLRITLRVVSLPRARPGQFVHLSPELRESSGYRVFEEGRPCDHDKWLSECSAPLIRRAFSIAGLNRSRHGVDVQVIYRVVGTATRWMQSLSEGDSLSMIGPLGNHFPVSSRKAHAWLVAGGVGLPPMLWLAPALRVAQRRVVAFCGVRSAELLPLTLDTATPIAEDARTAHPAAREFAECGVPVVLSSDDGSIGFRGHIGTALTAYHQANPIEVNDLIVYTCGPERMMRFVAGYCATHGIECYACMERSMACGTGTCQSCVVPVGDASQPDGWRYRLCCTDGPVFPAADVEWDRR